MATFFSRANDALTPANTDTTEQDNTIYIFILVLVSLIIMRD
jgi:hypothetical protein